MEATKQLERALHVSAGRSAVSSGRVRPFREKHHLSQRDVAQAIGVTAAAVSRWEKGNRIPSGVSAQRLQALMAALEKAS